MRGCVVLISLWLCARAHAQTPAEQAKAEAEALAAKSDFAGAAAKYREAYAADPRAEYMCNVGVAYYKAKDLPRAERYLDQCLVVGKSLDPAFLDTVAKVERVVVEQLQKGNFTPLDLVVEPSTASTRIPTHDDPIVGSRRVWLPFGSYRLNVHAEGYDDQTVDLEANGHDPVVRRIVLVHHVITVEDKKPPPVAEQPLPDAPARSKTPAWIATGVTGAATLTAVGFWIVARSNASKAGSDDNPEAYFSHVDMVQTNQHRSWYAGAAAGVCAVASAVLWYRVAF